MSETKFTRGPWEWEASRNDVAIFTDEQHSRLAEVYRYPTAETRNANARLICAAPDMYAALEQCVAQLEIITGQVHDERMALIAGKAALAKARGES